MVCFTCPVINFTFQLYRGVHGHPGPLVLLHVETVHRQGTEPVELPQEACQPFVVQESLTSLDRVMNFLVDCWVRDHPHLLIKSKGSFRLDTDYCSLRSGLSQCRDTKFPNFSATHFRLLHATA